MSYIKYVSKDFQAALDGDNSEDSNNENVVSQNSACDLVEDISSSLSISASKCVVRKYCTHHWQRKWNITDSGRSTYELVPIFSQKHQLPSCRSTAVSFVRMLLHESQLHRQPYRLPAKHSKTVYSCVIVAKVSTTWNTSFWNVSNMIKLTRNSRLRSRMFGTTVNSRKSAVLRYLCC